jgi:Protein of unknown function (DUF2914)
MSDNKLKIRIHLQQPNIPGENDQGDQDGLGEKSFPQHWNVLEKPPFDWRRIAVALTAFAVLAGVAGYLFFDNNKIPDVNSFDGNYSETDGNVDYSARFNTFDGHQSSLPLLDEQPESPENTQETTNPVDNNDSVGNGQLQDAEAENKTPEPRMKPLRLDSAKMLVPPKPVMKPAAAETDSESASKQLRNARDVAGIPGAAEVTESVTDHSTVIRAQLTQQIRQREPVGEAYRVLLGDNDSSSIYFFIELSDYEGQQLIVDWYFEDRLVTETKLHVGARKWRTNAKKLLRKRDAGTWRVILRDQAGRLLAERKFVVEA